MNWKEIGGPDSLVIPVILNASDYPATVYIEKLIGSASISSNIIKAKDLGEFQNIINTIEGSIGLIKASDAEYFGLQTLELKYFEKK